MKTHRIIGIHAPTSPSQWACVVMHISKSERKIEHVHTGFKGLEALLLSVLEEAVPALLTIDCPLGWPEDFSAMVHRHQAGLPTRSRTDALFYRQAELMLAKEFALSVKPVASNRVGQHIDKVLKFIDQLGMNYGMRIPLAWDNVLSNDAQIIEVNPDATLISKHLFPAAKLNTKARSAFIEASNLVTSTELARPLCDNPLFTAYCCAVAGEDFLTRQLFQPASIAVAKKEGWVWVAKSATAPANGQ